LIPGAKTISEHAELVIIGAGAAGLMASIWAGRTNSRRKIILLDGARKPGAKILVSGGGRCNVTHDQVDANAYAGASRNAIRKVLRRFDAAQTVAFFRELGLELKRESTGKLFPVTNSARTVLEALLRAAHEANVDFRYPCRVESLTSQERGFLVGGEWGQLETDHVILATGGRSLPKSGSDGSGYTLARALGHQMTGRVFPALVPLTLPKDHFICGLSGLTLPATLTLCAQSGKRLATFTDSTLCTHFGLSGPAVLNMSRYYIAARFVDAGATLLINWLPGKTTEQAERELLALGKITVLRYLGDQLPERLTRALCAQAGLAAGTAGDQLEREQRKALARCLTALPLPITGNRGFDYAEVTAGGIPLDEVHLDRMESRVCAGLYLCGELLDVDGLIGGYNFQWAWASGYTAGISA
jgi:predicted Rossmann fold flavoprotein